MGMTITALKDGEDFLKARGEVGEHFIRGYQVPCAKVTRGGWRMN